MARIRSIHPGLFTDEAFMSMSMAARVLLLGLWTEADDHGVFEWKPITLKARLMPADNVVVADLLTELREHDAIDLREHGGSKYGLIRNFCRYQRPKNPAYKHNFPQDWGSYVGLKDAAPPALPQDTPSATGKPSLMEEGEKEEGIPPNPPQAGGTDASQGEGEEPDQRSPRARGTNPRAKDAAAEEARLAEARRLREADEDSKWHPRLAEYSQTGKWPSVWGTAPSVNPNIIETGVLLPRRLWPQYREIHGQRDIKTVPAALQRAPDDIEAHYEAIKRRTA